MFARLVGAAMLGIGAATTALGAWLLSLGGSFYYAPTGAALMLCGLLAWRRDARALWLYAGILLATVVWSLWEVGLNAWALAPRLLAPFILGAALLPCGLRRGGVADGR